MWISILVHVMQESKHWKSRCQNWDLVLSQLELMFADRAAG